MRDPGLRRRLVFVTKFLAALLVFYVVLSTETVTENVVVPFTEGVVKATAFLLIAARQQIAVAGTVIVTPRFALDVHNGCNGIEAIMVLAAAMLAFPATLRSRISGLVVGSIAISILNLIRVGSLVWLGEYHRSLFDFVHVGVWQTLVILAAVSMFVFWSQRFAKPVQARS
jgi:exosortase H (IPTLxxWG-CTERM-specific)